MTRRDIKKATLQQLKGELKSCLTIALNIQEEIENRDNAENTPEPDYDKIHSELFKF
tara:strand:- start:10127 stop:10297 length:171 start_codon:yes stop_codon:yes gene_type:complete